MAVLMAGQAELERGVVSLRQLSHDNALMWSMGLRGLRIAGRCLGTNRAA